MNTDDNLQEILNSIEFTMKDIIRYDVYYTVIVNSDEEVIREFLEEDYVAAEKFFESLLSPLQLEALRIDNEITKELILEDQSNRELSC